MVMVPDGGGAVFIRILEDCESRPPCGAKPLSSFTCEIIVPCAFCGVTGRNAIGIRKIPGLGMSITFITHPNCTMHVSHNGNRASVQAGGFSKEWTFVAPSHSTGWVSPV